MKRSKFSEEPIVYALRQVDGGTPVGALCRQLGIGEATFYAGNKTDAHLGVSELRRLRQLEAENSRWKRLVADLSLDKHMLSEALRKTVEGPPAVGNSPNGFGRRFRYRARGPAAWRSSVGQPGIDAARRRINRRFACGFGIWPMPGPDVGACAFGCCCAGKAGA